MEAQITRLLERRGRHRIRSVRLHRWPVGMLLAKAVGSEPSHAECAVIRHESGLTSKAVISGRPIGLHGDGGSRF